MLLHTHTLLVLTLLLWVEQNGYTALHYAATYNSLKVAQLLLATKAAIDVQNNVRLPADGLMLCYDSAVVGQYGNTPIQIAQNIGVNGHQQMVALLQQHQQ